MPAAVFRSDLVVEAIGPGLWRVWAPLVFRYLGDDVTVPVGTVTDLASIPRFIDWVPGFDRDGISRRAAVVHDALYNLDRSKGKSYADGLLRAALISDGARQTLADAIYYGVHWFGGSAWRSDAGTSFGGFYTAADRAAWSGSLFSKAQ